MGSYTYYHCYACGHHSDKANGGKCPICGSERYYAEVEHENE